MANTKISQLPLYTGSTLEGYMVFNNSGETTTYKYKLPVDLGAGGGGSSPFEFLSPTSTSVKLSGTTVPSAADTSVNSMFIGNMNTAFVGPASYSFSIGNNNAPQTLTSYPGSYAYQFGSDNGVRGNGAYNAQFGQGNSTNANGWCYQFGQYNNAENGQNQCMFGGANDVSNSYTSVFGYGNVLRNQYSMIVGLSNSSTQSGGDSPVRFIHGYNNNIDGTSRYNTIMAGNSNTISSKNYVVMLGTSGRTADTQFCTFVENLKIFNYTNLDFVDDAAAAAGGVVLGQIYHTSGTLKVRIV